MASSRFRTAAFAALLLVAASPVFAQDRAVESDKEMQAVIREQDNALRRLSFLHRILLTPGMT